MSRGDPLADASAVFVRRHKALVSEAIRHGGHTGPGGDRMARKTNIKLMLHWLPHLPIAVQLQCEATIENIRSQK